jgi:hypothetical protein
MLKRYKSFITTVVVLIALVAGGVAFATTMDEAAEAAGQWDCAYSGGLDEVFWAEDEGSTREGTYRYLAICNNGEHVRGRIRCPGCES